MPLLVDTFNVLHVTGVLPPDLAGIDVEGLVALVQASRFAREKVELICDGGTSPPPPPVRHGSIIVRYSGYQSTADQMIAAIVRRIANPRSVTVVTADRAVQREARKRRCRVLTSEAFLQILADDAGAARRSARGPSRQQRSDSSGAAVDRWIRTFGISEEEFNAVADEATALADELAPIDSVPSEADSPRLEADQSQKEPGQTLECDEPIDADSVDQWLQLFGFDESVLEEIADEMDVELISPQTELEEPAHDSPPPKPHSKPAPAAPSARPAPRKVPRQSLNELPLPRDVVDEAESLWSQLDANDRD